MRPIIATLVLALSLLGCSGSKAAEQVPLVTVETQGIGVCLIYYVVDVVADPIFGTTVKGSGLPLKWPSGYTAWRAGSEVKVMDRRGNVVLTTGARYRFEPVCSGNGSPESDPNWIVATVKPCPGCKLETGLE